ncbi:MAG TPA: methyltransferase domain-containing protein [Actinomycetota bacterium]|nr:methyltransferase domain-containing protein [Actinomycetota bacterium]
MSERPQRRWDDMYAAEEFVWGREPTDWVRRWAGTLVPGSVADLGGGDGRNALFLAGAGHTVTVVDIAPKAIDNLLRNAREAGLADRVRGVVANLASYEPAEEFDNIVSSYTLTFVPRTDLPRVLDRIMSWTRDGGINIVESFTEQGGLAAAAPPTLTWFARGELDELYRAAGWEVLGYEEFNIQTKQRDESGQPHTQETAAVTARKSA